MKRSRIVLAALAALAALVLGWPASAGAGGPVVYGYAGVEIGGLDHPFGVAVAPNGDVYVTERGSSRDVKVFHGGTLVRQWPVPGPSWGAPSGIAVDASGDVYVADVNADAVYKFDSSGNELTQWGTGVFGDPAWLRPGTVRIGADADVYVLDIGWPFQQPFPIPPMVKVFTPDGVLLRSFSVDVGSLSLAGLAVDTAGTVYVSQVYDAQITRWAPDGTLLGSLTSPALTGPAGMAFSGDSLFVANGPNVVVMQTDGTVLGTFGECCTGPGMLWGATDVAVDSLGYAYVVDQINAKVAVFAPATPPRIDVTLSPAEPASGWWNQTVSVHWSVDFGGFGGSTSGCNDVIQTAEGTSTYTCTATSDDGVTASKSVDVAIDETPPAITYTGNKGYYALTDRVSLTCTANDAFSGVQDTNCGPIDEPASFWAPGTVVVKTWAVDRAGNRADVTQAFTIVGTPVQLADAVSHIVTDPRTARLMTATLNAPRVIANPRLRAAAEQLALRVFLLEVRAATGRSVTAGQAALLTHLATPLLR